MTPLRQRMLQDMVIRDLAVLSALLHKSPEGRVSPYPKRIYGIATVTGVPS